MQARAGRTHGARQQSERWARRTAPEPTESRPVVVRPAPERTRETQRERESEPGRLGARRWLLLAVRARCTGLERDWKLLRSELQETRRG
jgi:hypothetical protein